MNPLLNRIDSPEDLRKIDAKDLIFLAEELRAFVQEKTKTKEGHIKSSLGVVELTIGLHYIFNTPIDILIWDVGHQAYIHKILTERKNIFGGNRQMGGISGFTNRSESLYDPFGAGHSSTSISAAVGFAESAKLKGLSRKHIAVIGDGALTGGESFEALNYLGERQLDVLVVINDNEGSIDANVGALSKFGDYKNFCSALNLQYWGKVEGHNLDNLLAILKEAKETKGPSVIRVITQKAKGWIEKVKNEKSGLMGKSFQEIFALKMEALAAKNEKVVALSPAMISGSGLHKFQEKFPSRIFDAGIAEQHVVTMAAAMAADGLIPICHLYSTFAQRAYDQIVHDVALQNLPVVFCLDRAGLVGEDGATHHGAFDVGFLSTIPNLILSAALDGSSLNNLLDLAVKSASPFVIRYPKGGSFDENLSIPPFEVGKMRELKKGKKKAFISYGAIGSHVAESTKNTDFAHYDLIFLKPIDKEKIEEIFESFDEVISVEENSSAGGLGEKLAKMKAELKSNTVLKSIALPDEFVEHGNNAELYKKWGLDVDSIKKI